MDCSANTTTFVNHDEVFVDSRSRYLMARAAAGKVRAVVGTSFIFALIFNFRCSFSVLVFDVVGAAALKPLVDTVDVGSALIVCASVAARTS